MNLHLVRRVLWPQRKSVFAVVGATASLFGDFGVFLTHGLTAPALLAIFASAAAVFALWSWRKAQRLNGPGERTPQEVEAFVQSTPCDFLRYSLVAVAVYAVLMFVGGPDSTATETIGTKLGLIQQDVHAIRSDVADIHKDVEDLHEANAPGMIDKHPSTARAAFNNAWLYQNDRHDPDNAWIAIQYLYANFNPQKLDAAELYFEVGRQAVSRTALFQQMHDLATRKHDATLLIALARQSEGDDATALYAQARTIDPDMPFAWYDLKTGMANTTDLTSGLADPPGQQINAFEISPRSVQWAEDKAAIMAAKRIPIETALQKLVEKPVSTYYFMPQLAPDYEQGLRMSIDTVDHLVANYQQIAKSHREFLEQHPEGAQP